MKIATRCPACDGVQLVHSPAVLLPFVAYRVFGWEPFVTENDTAYSICNTIRCIACGMVFCDIRFDDDELARLYKGYWGEEYTAQRKQYEYGYGERVWQHADKTDYVTSIEWFLAPHLTLPVSILDWGGDTGMNTPFKDQSTKLHIYDIGDNPVKFGERVASGSPPYDLVVCGNVLEHAPYPYKLIQDILPNMSKDTVLYIEIPYVPSAFKSKLYWHEHINFFSEAAINRLLFRCGLDIIAARQSPPHFQVACKRKP
jgi:hypothetical protein